MTYYIVVIDDWYGGNTGKQIKLEEGEVLDYGFGSSNTEVKVFEDLKEAIKYRNHLLTTTNRDVIIIKQTSQFLQDKEKEISLLKDVITKHEQVYEIQERTFEMLYYAPGMPGALQAKDNFVSKIKPNLEQATIQSIPESVGRIILDQIPFRNACEGILTSKTVFRKYSEYLQEGMKLIDSYVKVPSMRGNIYTAYNEYRNSEQARLDKQYFVANKIRNYDLLETSDFILQILSECKGVYHDKHDYLTDFEQPKLCGELHKYSKKQFYTLFTMIQLRENVFRDEFGGAMLYK